MSSHTSITQRKRSRSDAVPTAGTSSFGGYPVNVPRLPTGTSGGWKVRSQRKKKTVGQRTSGFGGSAGDGKYTAIAYGNYANDITGTITHISEIPQGTSVAFREGKAFRLTSVQIRGTVESLLETTFAQAVNYLVWDRNPNKALAAITDILNAVADSSFPKRENAARFVILRRWAYVVTGETDTKSNAFNTMHEVNEYVKLPPDCVCQCTVADTTGEIANRIAGALLWVNVGSTARAGDLGAITRCAIRVNYVDV